MPHLSLAGVSKDGSRLLLVDDRGAEFTLDITTGLKAALRGDPTRLGQLEITMDSALRPRDIQARIRAGESAEAVAEVAQTTVERIMPFAGPVLAERAHVADRAQRAIVRRRAGETSGARTLGDVVSDHLRGYNVDPGVVEWDAWRREDGRWSLVGAFDLEARSGTAALTFDLRGNYVVPDDDDARWLVGESLSIRSDLTVTDDLSEARSRRRAGRPGYDGELGDDAIDLVSGEEEPGPDPRADGDPIEAFLDTSPASDDPAVRESAADVAGSEADPRPVTSPGEGAEVPEDPDEPGAAEGADEAPARRTVAKKRGRASVPSWDEIMFGGNDS